LRQVRRAQDPSKEYGPTSAGALVAISLHLRKMIEEIISLRQRSTKIDLQFLDHCVNVLNAWKQGERAPNLSLLSALSASGSPIGSSELYTSGYRNAIPATNSPIEHQRVGHTLERLWNGWFLD
jgi:hypothetical protein